MQFRVWIVMKRKIQTVWYWLMSSQAPLLVDTGKLEAGL